MNQQQLLELTSLSATELDGFASGRRASKSDGRRQFLSAVVDAIFGLFYAGQTNEARSSTLVFSSERVYEVKENGKGALRINTVYHVTDDLRPVMIDRSFEPKVRVGDDVFVFPASERDRLLATRGLVIDRS